jgi:branched-chain amino acid transport system substrate-binding protein
MAKFDYHSSGYGSSTRRCLLKGFGGTALVAGSGLLGLRPSLGATDSDFSPWFGAGGPASGAGLVWAHGMNVPLTGGGADIGKVMVYGAQLAAKVIVASGGPKMTIELNDNQSGLVPPSVQGIRRLISQKGIKSLASSYGPATESIFPITNQFEVPTFWTGGPQPSGLNRPYVFLTIAMWALDATPGGVAYMAKNFAGSKRLAILGSNENGLQAVNQLAPKAWADAIGGQVVYKELVNANSTDFSSSVSHIRAAKPDVIFTTLNGNDAGFFIKQAREAGIKAAILLVDLSPPVAKIAGSLLADNCYLTADGYLATNPNPYNQAFVKAYRAQYGTDPDYFAANWFEVTMLVWAAIQRSIKSGGRPGRGPSLTGAIEADPSFPSLYGGGAGKAGVMTFNKDHSVTKPLGVFKIGEGGAVTKVASISKGSTELMPA